ncbi:MAG: TolB family protein, partial [Gemmatimonadales bacterium]
PKAPRRNVAALAAVAVAVVAAIAAVWGWLRPPPAPQISRFSLFFRPGEGLQPTPTAGNIAISPDGRKLVYVGPGEGSARLWLRELEKLRPTPIPGTEGAVSPFFSPDGRQLGFIRNGRTVRVLSLDGGPPLTLSDSINSTAGDWGDDGYIYVEVDSGMARVRASGGPLEPIYKFSAERREIGTEFSNVLPGGKGLVFRVRRAGQPPTEFDVFGMKLPNGEARPLIRGIYARYAASGHLLVVTADGKLLAVPFDPDKLALTGPAVAILEGLRSGPFEQNMAVARNGAFVYATGGSSASTLPFWVDREGKATPMDPAWDPQGSLNTVALSADGKILAVGMGRDGSGPRTSGSSSSRPVRSRGSPSGTIPTSAPPGPRTAGRWSTSPTRASGPACPR